jgi:putative oxidoreductase
MDPMTRFFATDRSVTLLFQRLVLALVMLPHGAQKTLGWFGGHGFEGTMGFFTGTLGLPAALALLVILGESLGALALLAGGFTRLAAFGIAATMVGAVAMAHLANGFFMNWSGQQAGEGFEYHLLALALAVPLVVRGGGLFAVDSWLARWFGRAEPVAATRAPLAEAR